MNVGNFINRYLGIPIGTTCDLNEISGIFCIAAKAIGFLLGIAGGIAFILLIVGGVQYMIAGGDEKALTTAKSTITSAVLGLLVILGSFLIIETILRGLVQ